MRRLFIAAATWLALAVPVFAQDAPNPYNPLNWYWAVQDSSPGSQVWASARGQFVALSDSTYVAWLAAGNVTSSIDTAIDLYSLITAVARTVPRPLPVTLNASASIAPPAPQIVMVNTSGAGEQINLPQMNLPTSLPLGTPFYILNEGPDDITIKAFDTTTTIAAVKANSTVVLFSGAATLNSTNGIWTVAYLATTTSPTDHITFQPGLVTSVTNNKSAFYKFSTAASIANITGSASTFTCSVNPVVTIYDCGNDASCASPTAKASVTVTSSGVGAVGTVTSTPIAAGDFLAWSISNGTCTALDIAATVQTTPNPP